MLTILLANTLQTPYFLIKLNRLRSAQLSCSSRCSACVAVIFSSSSKRSYAARSHRMFYTVKKKNIRRVVNLFKAESKKLLIIQCGLWLWMKKARCLHFLMVNWTELFLLQGRNKPKTNYINNMNERVFCDAEHFTNAQACMVVRDRKLQRNKYVNK